MAENGGKLAWISSACTARAPEPKAENAVPGIENGSFANEPLLKQEAFFRGAGPYWIADGLVHEFFHNRLSFIEEPEAILANAGTEDGETSGEFYSPWRDDLRPLSGLLHAIYVYIAVSQFWFFVLRSGETSTLRTAYSVDQAVRATLQLRIASRLLRRYA